MTNKNIFYHLVWNTWLTTLWNNFLWFCLVFWAYLETRSVMVTSLIWWIYLVAIMFSWIFFWALVDHNKKKIAMIWSTFLSLIFYLVTAFVFFSNDVNIFKIASNIELWILVIVIMLWVVIWNIRMIALSTTVTMLFEEEERAKANWLVGIVNAIWFWIVSVFSWFTVWLLGMWWAIVISIILMVLSLVHLFFIKLEEKLPEYHEENKKEIDLKWTIKIVASISGLFALIFFTLFNNFLWWVFMSLMDPYGLSLVSVEVRWIIWWFLSTWFIVWWALITKFWLWKNPLKTLMIVNIIMWIQCIFFTSYSSIVLTAAWLFMFMVLHPFVEAAEQTILQKVVPFERQWRVFWFAQSVEQTASPLTAFFIWPIAELFVIPFMTTWAWVAIFGSWFGSGDDRALALIFSVTWIIWLIVTLLAFASKSYRNLSKKYLESSN